MKNFNVLLKYSLKPKFIGKKQLISYLLLLLFPMLLIGLGGQLALNLIENDDSSEQIADIVYIYPKGDLATVLSSNFNDAEIVAEPDQVIANMQSDDDKSELIIDLETNQITSDFEVGIEERYTLSSIINEYQIQTVISQLDSNSQKMINQANEEFAYNTVAVDENDNNSILHAIGFVNTLAIYMIIIFGFQLLGSEIFEEKSSRAMEIIITNTKPHVHMLVKICSTLIFLLSIFLTLLIGAIVGVSILYNTNPTSVGIVIDQILEVVKSLNIAIDSQLLVFTSFTLISGLFAVLLFQIVAAVAAAMTTSYEDYQKANGPIVIFLLVPYFISMMNIEVLSRVLVYVPFFTPFFAPSLYLGDEISLLVYGLCILIQLVTLILIYVITAPIYREGLLNYSTSNFREIIIRSYKNK